VSRSDRRARNKKRGNAKLKGVSGATAGVRQPVMTQDPHSEYASTEHPAPDYVSPQSPQRFHVGHRDVAFKDDVIYLSGHAYDKCRFERCTFILKDDLKMQFGNNKVASNCAIHVDVLMHDKHGARDLIAFLTHWLNYLGGPDESEPQGGKRGSFDAASVTISPPLPSESPPANDDIGSSERDIE
jgi:hypothetical protein